MTTPLSPLKRRLLEFAARGRPGVPVLLFDRPDDRFGPSALREVFADVPPADVFEVLRWLVDDTLIRAVNHSSISCGPFWVVAGVTAKGADALEGVVDPPARKRRESPGRTPSAVHPVILVETGAWVAATGSQDLAEVKKFMRAEMIRREVKEPAGSTLDDWAGRVLEAHKRQLKNLR